MSGDLILPLDPTHLVSLKEGEYFLLQSSDLFFMIKEGVVDLFFFEKADITAEQTTLYIASFEKNEILVAPSKRMSPPYLFLRAHTNVVLSKVFFDSLTKSEQKNEVKEAFLTSLSCYLMKVESVFSQESIKQMRKVTLATHEKLAQGTLVCFKSDKKQEGPQEILWMQYEGQGIKINELDDCIFERNEVLPITRNDLIFAKETVEISFLTSDQINILEIGSKFLDLFYQKIFSRLQNKLIQDKKIQKLRLLQETVSEKKLIEDSCFLLSQVLNIKEKAAFNFSTDLLLKACQHIALYHHSPITLAKLPSDLQEIEQKVAFIAEKSNFSYRKVKLEKELLTKDFEPLLVFENTTNEPRVILSNGRKKYFLINPNDNSKSLLSFEKLKDLAPFAIVFYKDLPKEPKGKALFKLIFENQWFDIFVIVFIAVISAGIALYSPIAMGWIFDKAVPSHNQLLLAQILLGLFMVGVGRSVFSFASAIALLRIEGKTSNKLQAALWNRLLNLKLKFFKDYTVGDLWQRVGAVNEIRALLSNHTLNTLVSSFFSFFYFGVMLYRSVFLAILMLIPVFLTIIIYIAVISMTIKRQLDVLNYQGAIYGNFVGVIDSIKKIRMFNAENRAFAKWSSLFSIKKRKEIELMMINNWLGVSHKIINNFGTILMYFVVIGFLMKKSEGKLEGSVHIQNIGEYLSFSAAYGSFSGAIYALGGAALSMMKDIIPRWKRAKVLFEAEEEKRNLSDKFERLHGEIEFNKISFRYSSNAPQLLNELSFKIKRGSSVGIIGASGSGKSTIIRLILGFEKPDSGMVLFDERLQESFDIRFLRQQLAVVLQTGAIFLGSFRDNICSSRTYSDSEILDVLDLCCLKDEVESLPMGLETVLPPGGGTLSAGQRQRLLLARALIQKPSILILDDCLSAIDDDVLELIKKNLQDLDITIMMISQKINLIKDVSEIMVLSEGKIAEQGTYFDLIEKKGVFYQIIENETL